MKLAHGSQKSKRPCFGASKNESWDLDRSGAPMPPGRVQKAGDILDIIHISSIENPIGSMYAIYDDIYHQYTPNVSIYTVHGSYGIENG